MYFNLLYILNVFFELGQDRLACTFNQRSSLSIISFQNFIFAVANKSETVCWLSLSCLDGDDWLVFS